MNLVDAVSWVMDNDRREITVLALRQPVTPGQLARCTDWTLDTCCFLFREMTARRITFCLNPSDRRHRLYWLTTLGVKTQRRVRRLRGYEPELLEFPPITDWSLYGAVCHRHREAVVKALAEAMRPAAIKRRALQRDETLRMSVGHTRAVVRYLRQQGLVESVVDERWPAYRLTQRGDECRKLLLGAESLEIRSPQRGSLYEIGGEVSS